MLLVVRSMSLALIDRSSLSARIHFPVSILPSHPPGICVCRTDANPASEFRRSADPGRLSNRKPVIGSYSAVCYENRTDLRYTRGDEWGLDCRQSGERQLRENFECRLPSPYQRMCRKTDQDADFSCRLKKRYGVSASPSK